MVLTINYYFDAMENKKIMCSILRLCLEFLVVLFLMKSSHTSQAVKFC